MVGPSLVPVFVAPSSRSTMGLLSSDLGALPSLARKVTPSFIDSSMAQLPLPVKEARNKYEGEEQVGQSSTNEGSDGPVLTAEGDLGRADREGPDPDGEERIGEGRQPGK